MGRNLPMNDFCALVSQPQFPFEAGGLIGGGHRAMGLGVPPIILEWGAFSQGQGEGQSGGQGPPRGPGAVDHG